jgi:hypothetical protein
MVGDPGQPVTIETPATPAWHEPLSFRCYDAGHGITCCVISPRE